MAPKLKIQRIHSERSLLERLRFYFFLLVILVLFACGRTEEPEEAKYSFAVEHLKGHSFIVMPATTLKPVGFVRVGSDLKVTFVISNRSDKNFASPQLLGNKDWEVLPLALSKNTIAADGSLDKLTFTCRELNDSKTRYEGDYTDCQIFAGKLFPGADTTGILKKANENGPSEEPDAYPFGAVEYLENNWGEQGPLPKSVGGIFAVATLKGKTFSVISAAQPSLPSRPIGGLSVDDNLYVTFWLTSLTPSKLFWNDSWTSSIGKYFKAKSKNTIAADGSLDDVIFTCKTLNAGLYNGRKTGCKIFTGKLRPEQQGRGTLKKADPSGPDGDSAHNGYPLGAVEFRPITEIPQQEEPAE